MQIRNTLKADERSGDAERDRKEMNRKKRIDLGRVKNTNTIAVGRQRMEWKTVETMKLKINQM